MALVDAVELARAGNALLKSLPWPKPPIVSYGKGGGPGQGWHALMDTIKEMMRERLVEAVESVPDEVRVKPVLVSGEPAAALAETAIAESDLLMLGSRAYGPLRRVLLGSVSTPLVRSAPCPLIVHPRPGKTRVRSSQPLEAGSAS